jgi:predicted nucleic acid-binding protein
VAEEQGEVSKSKRLVLDANILLRAVFGVRVRSLLQDYEESISFYSPDVCFDDARRYIPDLAKRRSFDPALGLSMLEQVGQIVELVDRTLYSGQEATARRRMSARDEEDWPVLAVALMLDAPVWTEDQDFFGSGIATWTTNRIEMYLGQE